MMKTDESPGREIKTAGDIFLYFGGTAYLGLPTNEIFQNILIQNIRRWGTAYGSSRSANITLNAYENGEAYLTKLVQSEAAVTVSSGMLAGKLVIEELTKSNNRFFHFPRHHPAINANNSQPFYIDGQINPNLLNEKEEDICLLTDAVPAFQIKAIDLEDVKKISVSKKITLVIDESHSLGLLGENGGGIFSTIVLPNVTRKIMVGSLGKALGLTGGIIASDAIFIQQIKQSDCFVGGAGMNPAFVQTMVDAKDLIIIQQQRLKKNLSYIHQVLKPDKNLPLNINYPVIYPCIDTINSILENHKIVITNFKYPTGVNDLNRIVFTANHTKEDIDRLVEVLNKLTF